MDQDEDKIILEAKLTDIMYNFIKDTKRIPKHIMLHWMRKCEGDSTLYPYVLVVLDKKE